MMMEWFKARNTWGELIISLPDDEAGMLAKVLWKYTMYGEVAELPEKLKPTFLIMRSQLDWDKEKADEVAAKKAVSGALGGKRTQEKRREELAAGEFEADQADASKNKIKKKKKDPEKESEEDQDPETEREKKRKDEAFARFWSFYPRHQDMTKARQAFDALDPDEELLDELLDALKVQMLTPQWTSDGGQFIPLAATWLQGKRWEDEI